MLWAMIQPASADWINSNCVYNLTNNTSRRVYFFLNTKQTSLAVGERLVINTCDSTPFPRLSVIPSHPFFSHPTVIFDAKLGDGYVLKTMQLTPGENAFSQSHQQLRLKYKP